MEIDNEREGEVEWATYKQTQRHGAGANRKRVQEREEDREWWRDEGGGSERGRRQMWGQVLLSAQKTHVKLLLTGGTNYWQQEGKEVFHCHTRKRKLPFAETYYCFFSLSNIWCAPTWAGWCASLRVWIKTQQQEVNALRSQGRGVTGLNQKLFKICQASDGLDLSFQKKKKKKKRYPYWFPVCFDLTSMQNFMWTRGEVKMK